MKSLLLGLLLVAVASHATEDGDHTALFEEAVDAINWDFDEEWAYTETRLEDDVLWVARFDPRKPAGEQWTLESVGGRAPTRDELSDFADDKEDHHSSDGSQRTNIVGADTLELVEETDQRWTFNFVPEEDEIGFGENIDAVLSIVKDGPFLESVNIRNRTDLKPGFGTKLTTFQFQMQFGPTTDGRAVVPRAMKVKVVGRALLFIGFEETEIVTYSDFEFAGAEISAMEALADEYLAAVMERYPSMATQYSIEGASHDRLFDNSLEAQAEWQQREDAWMAGLTAIEEPADIGSRDWVSYGIMRESLESAIELRVCRNELWQASSATGWHLGLPFLFEIQPVDSEDHREQTLARLAAVPGYIDTEIANLRQGLELGYSAPRVTVEVVPEQVRSLLGDDSIFLNPATRAGDSDFEAAVRKIYDDEIVPAVNRFADFVEEVYLQQARQDISLSANPNGAECYPARVRSFVTISPPADEIHKLGLQQLERIQAEMRTTIDEHFGGGSVAEFMRRLNNDPDFTFESEDAVVQYSIDGLDAAKSAMSRAFGTLPIADVLVKPYPDFAASGSGEYHSSSEDGSRPGIFYIAVLDPQKRSRSNQLSTLYHETYPGHHLQGAIALELGGKVHPIARYFWNSGFGEGWALYAERVADELGLYFNPLDHMGLYSDQGARAARLVIDTGLHTKGWTRQQAVDFMMANTGWTAVDIQNEIDRYIAWPGQANAYMLGMLEIRRLRDLAEQELGDDFDLRAFHDRVVGFGSITLPMLHVSILAWIEEQKSSG